MIKDRRIGRFIVGRALMLSADKTNLFHNMVVLRAEQRFDSDSYEYIAWHPEFRLLHDGELAPEYTALLKSGDTKPAWNER